MQIPEKSNNWKTAAEQEQSRSTDNNELKMEQTRSTGYNELKTVFFADKCATNNKFKKLFFVIKFS